MSELATLTPLAQTRIHLGLRQADVAQRAGVSRETISRLERGKTPQLRTAHAIAGVLNAPLEAVFPLTEQTDRAKS